MIAAKAINTSILFASIFWGLQKVSDQKTDQYPNAHADTDIGGHLNKEITGQADTDHGFGDIGKEFRQEFLFGFVKDSH